MNRVLAAMLAPFGAIRDALRPYCRIDRDIAILSLVFAVLFFPLIPRGTQSPQFMAAFSNDEPWQTMALDGMTAKPYGNPANFFDGSREPPAYWGDIKFPGMLYYGGALFDVGLLAYAPLRAIGLPAFPTAPIVLRAISALCALAGLMLLYNFSRLHAGRLAALIAAAVLLTDDGFLYYATNIKPDTLQFMLGLMALAVAVHHAGDRRRASLFGLGVLAGLIQGTKAGGPWLIPLAALAAWMGTAGDARRLSEFAQRCLLMGAAALAVYLATTPYAIIDPYFFSGVKQGWNTLTQSPLPPISLTGWLMELYVQWGPILCVLGAAGLAQVLFRAWRGESGVALPFAALLILSQLFWYGAVVRVWASLGYMLLGLGLFACFAGQSFTRLLDWVARRGASGRAAAAACGIALALLVAEDRWHILPVKVLHLHMFDRDTVVEANRWAIANRVPAESRIVFDDIAYFDPARFPRAHMHGGVMRWTDVKRYNPDYLVISLDVLAFMPYSGMMKTQRLSRNDENPYSMRLYQDLLFQETPGPTQVPGVELTAILRPTLTTADAYTDVCALWVGNRGTYEYRDIGLSEIPHCRGAQLLRRAQHVGYLLENFAGRRHDLIGGTVRIFRVNSAKAS